MLLPQLLPCASILLQEMIQEHHLRKACTSMASSCFIYTILYFWQARLWSRLCLLASGWVVWTHDSISQPGHTNLRCKPAHGHMARQQMYMTNFSAAMHQPVFPLLRLPSCVKNGTRVRPDRRQQAMSALQLTPEHNLALFDCGKFSMHIPLLGHQLAHHNCHPA